MRQTKRTKAGWQPLLIAYAIAGGIAAPSPPAFCHSAGPVSALPATLRPLADQYLKPGQTPSSASDTMDQIAAQMTPDLVRQLAPQEGSDIRAKLALIAWDRRQHPEMYQELDALYLRSFRNPPGWHVMVAPGVRPEHSIEKYRLAWEYLLVTPVLGQPSPMWNQRALEALSKIKDNASLLTLRQALAATTAPGFRCDENRNWQQTLLGEMAVWQNPQALQTILEGMALIQKQQAQAVKGDETWDVAKEVRENGLARIYHPAENARWRAIIEAYPRTKLTADQQNFLDSVLDAIAKNPDIPPGLDPKSAAELRADQAAQMRKDEAAQADAAKLAP